MKTKTLKTILGIIAIAAVILAGCENPDGSCNLLWSLTFLGIAGFSGLGYDALKEDER